MRRGSGPVGSRAPPSVDGAVVVVVRDSLDWTARCAPAGACGRYHLRAHGDADDQPTVQKTEWATCVTADGAAALMPSDRSAPGTDTGVS